jgi:hypothetical protein
MKDHVRERRLLERIEAVVKEEGFSQVQAYPSSYAWTLSAEKESIRLVVHLEDQAAPTVPRSSPTLKATPIADSRLTASLSGALPQPGRAVFAGNSGGSQPGARD